MTKIGELDLLPISKWEAYPTYYIGAGGIGYLIISWLMYYLDQYLPDHQNIRDFRGARFMTLDTALPDKYDLPDTDLAQNTLFRIDGNLNKIIEEVQKGKYPGIEEYYPLGEETVVAEKARKNVGELKDGAGTTRPFGRIGYFYNFGELYERLTSLISEKIQSEDMKYGGKFEILVPERGGTQRRCFFIVSSLAGGTGSSCFLDIAATLRKIHQEKFPHEKWSIIGIFTLAEVLAIDTKVDQEVKRNKMRANSYAALKELNHFLEGNSFKASYGVDGSKKVDISNTREDDCLFDLVHLVDTPNQDKSPLSGRMEVAQFLAQSLLYLGGTEISREFFNRVVDSKANLYFENTYPPSSNDIGITLEKQQSRFSTLGLCRLMIPVKKYIEYGHIRFALELIDCLLDNTNPVDITQEAKQIKSRCRLNADDLDREFNICSGALFEVSPNLLEDLRAAQNPVEELREQIERMMFNPNEILECAGRISREQIQRIFPAGGEGKLKLECDRLVDEGSSDDIYNVLKVIEQNLKDYHNRLINELQDARNQIAVQGENVTRFEQTILNNRSISQTLQDMELNWPGWSRILRWNFRNRFIERYEGEINLAADLMKRMQHVAFITSVWQVKIQMVHELITKIEELSSSYQKSQLQMVRQWFLEKKTLLERSLTSESRFLKIAVKPEVYYENLFFQVLGDKDTILRQISQKLRDGITLNGMNIPQSRWDDYNPRVVAEAIMIIVKESVTPQFPYSDNTEYADTDTPGYYKINLENAYFLPDKKPTFFDKMLSEWKRKAQVSLLFNTAPPEVQRYVVSGCRTDSSLPYSWQKVLNLLGLSLLNGGTPNQAILLNLGLGFPLTNLSRVKEWYSQQYLTLKRQGWPLHLFPEEIIEMMTEPHLDWISLPDMAQANELYEEARKLRILSELQTGDGSLHTYWDRNLIRKLPASIKDFFFEYLPQPKSFEPERFKDMLQEQPDLTVPLKDTLIRYNPPEEEKSSWDEWKSKIAENKDNVESILQWLLSANLASINEMGQVEIDTNLYREYRSSQPRFCYYFFELIPTHKTITKNECIKALAAHQPLSRWITKKMLAALISIEKLDETKRKYKDGEFSEYLHNALAEILP